MPSELPPSLPAWRWRQLRLREFDHELIWSAMPAAVGAAAGMWLYAGLPWPHCAFKAVTGCPCVACGATRAVLQLGQGRLGAALAFNPLVVAGVMAWALFASYALLVLLLRAPRLRPVAVPPGLARRLRFTALCLLAANWAWVIWRGN